MYGDVDVDGTKSGNQAYIRIKNLCPIYYTALICATAWPANQIRGQSPAYLTAKVGKSSHNLVGQ